MEARILTQRLSPGAAMLAAGLLAFLCVVIANAWVTEDAYITFRVIDNALSGYGLRWNAGERVQAYTHPLWMLLHLPLAALWPNLFHADIFLSVLCSMAALWLGIIAARQPPLVSLACFLLPLACSRAFMDYTTSGLENPLSFLLYAAFGYVALRTREHSRFWFYLSVATALMMLNRLDSILLIAPALLYLAATQRPRWSHIILGLLPLLAWLAFSLLYYGFLFPNTKYAKLDTGLSLYRYLDQGLHYARYTLELDTPSLLVMISMIFFVARARRSPLPAALALGVLFNAAYVIWIGGDYLAGRFWAVPVFASAFIWHAFLPRPRPDALFAACCLLAVAYAIPYCALAIRDACPACVVANGRLVDGKVIFGANRLLPRLWPLKIRSEGRYGFAKKGKELARLPHPPAQKMFYIGMAGYYAGPRVHLVDELALADPLLARLPAIDTQFYIGHFRRELPEGYLRAVESGDTSKMHPALAEYYHALHLITSGPLLDKARLKAIVAFNLGQYEHFRHDYLNR